MEKTDPKIETAELVVPCAELEPTLTFFTERLRFRIEAIFPADDPAVAVISGYGLRLRLERRGAAASNAAENIRLRLNCRFPELLADGQTELIAPNGVRIEPAASDPPLVLPDLKPSFVLTRFSAAAADWIVGRAGMLYRDLIPDRQGGRFIASHIRLPDGGPVPDYVHFHKIRFQMIYCYKGWARLVYEDQGEPFRLNAGDCVLQPPGIRHRVLESSAGLEVVEITCPAAHETLTDHQMTLPNPDFDPGREFGGQRFVRHLSSEGVRQKWRLPGFEYRATGIGRATGGLAGAGIVRPAVAPPENGLGRHRAELMFFFILQGTASLLGENEAGAPLKAGDALVIPAGHAFGFAGCSDDLEMLEVTLPAGASNLF